MRDEMSSMNPRGLILLLSCILVFLIAPTACHHTTEPPLSPSDTTSHDFAWSIDTLGNGNLYDVAVLNDRLAYAVGAIYARDSLGNWDPLPYNLFKWDGLQWKMIRVTVDYRGNQVTVPLEGVFLLSATDIWLAGSIPIHGDGNYWIGYDIQTILGTGSTVSRVWATPLDVYFAGRSGNIIHFASGTWQKLLSGTTLDMHDIWGAKDPSTGQLQILCVASNWDPVSGSKLLSISGEIVEAIPIKGLSWAIWSTWFVPEKHYYVVGAGIGEKNTLNDSNWSVRASGEVTRYASSSVRGNGINDVTVVGSFGEVVHYNGVSWRRYFGDVPFPNGGYASVAVKGDLIIAVGSDSQDAIALVGRRIP